MSPSRSSPSWGSPSTQAERWCCSWTALFVAALDDRVAALDDVIVMSVVMSRPPLTTSARTEKHVRRWADERWADEQKINRTSRSKLSRYAQQRGFRRRKRSELQAVEWQVVEGRPSRTPYTRARARTMLTPYRSLTSPAEYKIICGNDPLGLLMTDVNTNSYLYVEFLLFIGSYSIIGNDNH